MKIALLGTLVSFVGADSMQILEMQHKNLQELSKLQKEGASLARALEMKNKADVTINLDDLTTTGTEKNGSYQCPGDSNVLVEMSENASTGYVWTLGSNSCGVRFDETSSNYIEADSTLMGAAGEKQFMFSTPSADSNYIRDLPCNVTFSFGNYWDGYTNTTISVTV